MLSTVFLLVYSVYRAVGGRKEQLWDCEGEEDQFTPLQSGRENDETENRSVCKKIGFILFTENPHRLPLTLANKNLCCKKPRFSDAVFKLD